MKLFNVTTFDPVHCPYDKAFILDVRQTGDDYE